MTYDKETATHLIASIWQDINELKAIYGQQRQYITDNREMLADASDLLTAMSKGLAKAGVAWPEKHCHAILKELIYPQLDEDDFRLNTRE